MHTAESLFSNFVIEYLGEIEIEFENTLACLSGAQMGSNHEKNWRSKISWHTHFKQQTKITFWKSFTFTLKLLIYYFISLRGSTCRIQEEVYYLFVSTDCKTNL